MIDDDTRRIGVTAALSIAIPILIGWVAGLPVALYLGTVVVLLVGLVAVVHLRRRRPRAVPQPPPVVRPAPPPPAQTTVTAIELPSDTPDYRFRFSATVSWRPAVEQMSHGDPAALAREAIRSRAEATTATFSLAEHGKAQSRLAAALGVHELDQGRRMLAWATDVTLEVDDQDAARLGRLAELRKSVQLWEHERGHEVNVRRYLTDDVLKTTGSALVWWLSHDADDRIDHAVDRIAPLVRISAVARGEDDPGPRPDAAKALRAVPDAADPAPGRSDPDVDVATDLINRLRPSGDADERGVVADELANLADAGGRRDFGDRLRQAYGLYVEDPVGDGSASEDGPAYPESATGSG